MKKEEIVSLVKEMFGTPEAAWVSGVCFTPDMLQRVVDHAARVEREACAQLCNAMDWPGRSEYALAKGEAADECAAAIRARGDA